MKYKWIDVISSSVLACGLATSGGGCGPAVEDGEFGIERGAQSLIAGVGASDPALDAVGTVSFLHPADVEEPGALELICSASLIAPQTVLTAKHCVDIIRLAGDFGYVPVFTIGPDAAKPLRMVEVVDYRVAPGDVGGYVSRGHDVAALFLAEPVTDVEPLKFAQAAGADIGRPFAGVAFGKLDFGQDTGKRRVGQLTLRATEGRTFEWFFGSFAAYYEWYWGEPMPPGCDPEPGPVESDNTTTPSVAEQGGAGSVVTEPDCSIAELLWMQYQGLRLETAGELLAGGVAGDAQPCYGDSGAPLLHKHEGSLIAIGVVSGGISSSRQECDYGAIFAGLGSPVAGFLEDSITWVDPCAGFDVAGTCLGAVAQRCTHPLEGVRRLVRMDCGTVGLECLPQTDGTVGCGEEDVSFAEVPTPSRRGEALDRHAVEMEAFRMPASSSR